MVDQDVAQLEGRISADLVTRIGRGDREAEAQMVERYGRALLYLLKRRTGDHDLALDLRQETFRITIEKLRAEPIEEPGRLTAFLRGVAVNLVLGDHVTTRRATTADSDVVESTPDVATSPFDRVSGEQVERAVRALLRELKTERDREILTRLYIDDEDKESICASLGVDSVHFNRVLFRAKQRFREIVLRAERQDRLRLIESGTGN